ncbi:MAG: hypothetical protein ACRD3J_28775 [Thermoanaerobaculia bacterium]
MVKELERVPPIAHAAVRHKLKTHVPDRILINHAVEIRKNLIDYFAQAPRLVATPGLELLHDQPVGEAYMEVSAGPRLRNQSGRRQLPWSRREPQPGGPLRGAQNLENDAVYVSGAAGRYHRDCIVANYGIGKREMYTAPVAEKRLVAIADILGFSKLVEKQPPEIVVRESIGWARRCLYHALFRSGFPDEPPPFEEFRRHPHVGVAWFSDTVLLYARTDSDEDASFLIHTCSWLLFETIVWAKARMRLGVAYGELLIDDENSVHVGLAIVHANETEKRQEWSGGALHATAEGRLKPLLSGLPIVSYEVPVKPASSAKVVVTRLDQAIEWPSEIHISLEFLWSPTHPEATEDIAGEAGDIVRKFENTRLFHDEVCEYPSCRTTRGLPPTGHSIFCSDRLPNRGSTLSMNGLSLRIH